MKIIVKNKSNNQLFIYGSGTIPIVGDFILNGENEYTVSKVIHEIYAYDNLVFGRNSSEVMLSSNIILIVD